MQDIFVKSQWDMLWTFLQQGHPPLWVVLTVINGGFLLLWIYFKLTKDRQLRPATVGVLRALLFFLNFAAIYRDETIRVIRPLLNNIPFI
jgi:hypothetical protein